MGGEGVKAVGSRTAFAKVKIRLLFRERSDERGKWTKKSGGVRFQRKASGRGRCSLGDGVHGGGQVVDVVRRDAGDGDAAVLGQVDAELFGQPLDLRRRHAREAEHADLVRDVLPVATGSYTIYIMYSKKHE